MWDDLPEDVRAATEMGGPTAGSGVDTTSKRQVKHRDGNYWQVWTTWHATRDGIVVAQLRRELRRGEGKKFSPTGGIHLGQVDRYPSTEPPSRRHGVVPNPPPAEPGHVDQVDDEGPGDDEGERLLGYLPPVVQREARSTVSTPLFSDGELLQYSRSECPFKQVLTVVRLDAARAVVLSAARENDTIVTDVDVARSRLAALPWTITR